MEGRINYSRRFGCIYQSEKSQHGDPVFEFSVLHEHTCVLYMHWRLSSLDDAAHASLGTKMHAQTSRHYSLDRRLVATRPTEYHSRKSVAEFAVSKESMRELLNAQFVEGKGLHVSAESLDRRPDGKPGSTRLLHEAGSAAIRSLKKRRMSCAGVASACGTSFRCHKLQYT